jgi:hypothetical protein
VTEKAFLASVVELAGLTGWRVFHVNDSRRQVAGGRLVGDVLARGFPDLVLCHPKRGHLLVRELKVGRNRLTAEQQAWLDALRDCDVDAGVWRPEDWPRIERVLR